jgi:hypothetical protein
VEAKAEAAGLEAAAANCSAGVEEGVRTGDLSLRRAAASAETAEGDLGSGQAKERRRESVEIGVVERVLPAAGVDRKASASTKLRPVSAPKKPSVRLVIGLSPPRRALLWADKGIDPVDVQPSSSDPELCALATCFARIRNSI